MSLHIDSLAEAYHLPENILHYIIDELNAVLTILTSSLFFSEYAPTSYFQFYFSEWMAYYCLQCSSFSPAKALYNDIIIHRWQCHSYYLSNHTKMPLYSHLGLFKIKKFLSLEFLNSFKLLPFYVLILTEPYFLFLYELYIRSLERTGDPKQNRWVTWWETER